ncbi:MAG: PAS domain S-box protein [Gammaproteobacteria bacterium]
MSKLTALSSRFLLHDRRKIPGLHRVSTLLTAFVTVITLVAVLFVVHGYLRYQQYLDSQRELAEKIVNVTGNEIEKFIVDGNQHLSYFVERYIDLLAEVVNSQNKDIPEYFYLDDHLKDAFSDMTGFNMMGANGNLLLPDENRLFGDACIKDVLNYLRDTQNYTAYLHPETEHYHFDLMSKISIDDNDTVLLVSQPLDNIVNIFKRHKISGTTLILFNQVVDNLIEVSELGVRAHDDESIQRNQNKEQQEYARRGVQGSGWQLRAYTDGQQENIFKQFLIQQLAMIYIGFLILASLTLLYVLRLNNNRIKLFKQLEQHEDAINDQNLNLPLPYQSIDSDFNIRTINRAWCDMLGYELKEVIGQPISKFLFPEGMERWTKHFPDYVVEGGIDHETCLMMHKNGNLVEADIFCRFEYDLDGQFLYANCVLTNLTEKKQTSEHISSLEQRHSMHWQQTMVGVIEWDNDLRVIDWNPAAEAIFGFSKAEVMGLRARDFILPDSIINKVDHVRQALLAQEGGGHDVNQNLTKDNRLITCEWFNAPVTDGTGNVIGISSLVMDITLQTENLEIARQHKQELSQIIDSMVDAVITIDETGTVLSFSHAAEKIFGYNAASVIGQNVNLLMPEPDHSQHDRYLANYLTSGKENIMGLGKEVKGERKNGEVFPMRLSVSELPNQSGKPRRFVGSCIDISEQRKMEEAVRQSRKLEAIGEMAGGIAHDFNNLLGIISGNLEILKRYAGDNADMNKWIDSGLKTTKRGAALTKRLLGFSRVHAAAVKTVSVSNMLEDMRSMIEKTAGLKIGVNYGLEHDLWLTDIDTGDLEDAVINLVINAKDAMQGKGRLDISVYNEMVDEDKASYMLGSRAGDYVVLCVSDSGSGISKDVQQRMFDPFYSTKEKGKGTGLGLSLVHGFVRRSHGYVDVVSELGAGTAFYIYLPRSVKDKLKGLDSGVKDVLPTGTETILVVDDEPQLVEVATIYLGDLGYRVLQAVDTKQAMAFLQDSEKIDLLFSDIIMPGSMDGFGLSDAALRLRPEIKVLLVSGYTPEDSSISKEAKKLSDKRLAKPYSKTELAQRIRLVLDGEQKND